MKHHLTVCFQPHPQAVSLARSPVPHWTQAIADKSRAAFPLPDDVSAACTAFDYPVWVTAEFPKAAAAWGADEIAAGLDLIFRLVAQRDEPFPAGLVDAVRRLPYVAEASATRVAAGVLGEIESAERIRPSPRDGRPGLRLDEARLLTSGRPDVVVGLLDTGVWQQHPELAGVLVPGFDFVDVLDGADEFVGDYLGADPDPQDGVGHGTHIGGIIAGRGRRMPAGVAPRCRVLPVRVLGTVVRDGRRVGAGLVDNINNGIKYAVDRGATVLNMSLGLKEALGGRPHEAVVRYARAKGATVVAATGNDGLEGDYYPSALPGVIAVGAGDATGRATAFSTYGRHTALLAPGTDILSCFLDDGYAYCSGTSQAAGFVSGAAALVKSYALDLGRRADDGLVRDVLIRSCDRAGDRFWTPAGGYGRLNVRDALRLLEYELGGLTAGPTPIPQVPRGLT